MGGPAKIYRAPNFLKMRKDVERIALEILNRGFHPTGRGRNPRKAQTVQHEVESRFAHFKRIHDALSPDAVPIGATFELVVRGRAGKTRTFVYKKPQTGFIGK